MNLPHPKWLHALGVAAGAGAAAALSTFLTNALVTPGNLTMRYVVHTGIAVVVTGAAAGALGWFLRAHGQNPPTTGS